MDDSKREVVGARFKSNLFKETTRIYSKIWTNLLQKVIIVQGPM